MTKSLLYWNARGLAAHIGDLNDMITTERVSNRVDVDIFTFVETKMDPDPTKSPLPSITGYEWFSTPYSTPGATNCGGIAFLVRKAITARRLAQYDFKHDSDSTATAWLEI